MPFYLRETTPPLYLRFTWNVLHEPPTIAFQLLNAISIFTDFTLLTYSHFRTFSRNIYQLIRECFLVALISNKSKLSIYRKRNISHDSLQPCPELKTKIFCLTTQFAHFLSNSHEDMTPLQIWHSPVEGCGRLNLKPLGMLGRVREELHRGLWSLKAPKIGKGEV